MACALSASKTVAVATRVVAANAVRPAAFSKPAPALTFVARRAAPVERRAAAPVQALGAAEIMQVADEAGFIAGVTGTMMAMVLVGLAMGFVLLRVESLVEEGKI